MDSFINVFSAPKVSFVSLFLFHFPNNMVGRGGGGEGGEAPAGGASLLGGATCRRPVDPSFFV